MQQGLTVRNFGDGSNIENRVGRIEPILADAGMVRPLAELSQISRALRTVVFSAPWNGDGGYSIALLSLAMAG